MTSTTEPATAKVEEAGGCQRRGGGGVVDVDVQVVWEDKQCTKHSKTSSKRVGNNLQTKDASSLSPTLRQRCNL